MANRSSETAVKMTQTVDSMGRNVILSKRNVTAERNSLLQITLTNVECVSCYFN